MNCGYVALIGRPNVGKSTLLNHLLKQKISITSRKPQTTRHRILGINTTEQGQIIYLDTPGMHASEKRALNRYLNRTADTALLGVDVAVWVIDSLFWHDYDEIIFTKIAQAGVPVILVINKIDKIKDKSVLLHFLDQASRRYPFKAIVPVSALKSKNLTELETILLSLLPESNDLLYPEEQITDRPERFLCAEIVREKLTRRLGNELPYASTVEVEQYQEFPNLVKIYLVIWVERDSQKAIVIGTQGDMLKSIGSEARLDMERLLGQKVFIKLWVKVKKGWSDNERALLGLGFHD